MVKTAACIQAIHICCTVCIRSLHCVYLNFVLIKAGQSRSPVILVCRRRQTWCLPCQTAAGGSGLACSSLRSFCVGLRNASPASGSTDRSVSGLSRPYRGQWSGVSVACGSSGPLLVCCLAKEMRLQLHGKQFAPGAQSMFSVCMFLGVFVHPALRVGFVTARSFACAALVCWITWVMLLFRWKRLGRIVQAWADGRKLKEAFRNNAQCKCCRVP
jgi:hypothetical protein